MPHLSPDQQLPLWISTLRGLWLVARRDTQDSMLTELLPSLAMLLRQASAAQLLALAQALSTPLGTRGPSPASAMKPPLPAALIGLASLALSRARANQRYEKPGGFRVRVLDVRAWQRTIALTTGIEYSDNHRSGTRSRAPFIPADLDIGGGISSSAADFSKDEAAAAIESLPQCTTPAERRTAQQGGGCRYCK
ncbi:hypothetical protein B566_EDAN011870 [Ephemera danica]|nr:hypothetical protein B566_EDAN011870 [Ephemera danica]